MYMQDLPFYHTYVTPCCWYGISMSQRCFSCCWFLQQSWTKYQFWIVLTFCPPLFSVPVSDMCCLRSKQFQIHVTCIKGKAYIFVPLYFQTLLRIWDCFLLEGPKVLFRFSLAILHLHERDILQRQDTMGIMKHLKACTKLTYDVDGLMQVWTVGFVLIKTLANKCWVNVRLNNVGLWRTSGPAQNSHMLLMDSCRYEHLAFLKSSCFFRGCKGIFC